VRARNAHSPCLSPPRWDVMARQPSWRRPSANPSAGLFGNRGTALVGIGSFQCLDEQVARILVGQMLCTDLFPHILQDMRNGLRCDLPTEGLSRSPLVLRKLEWRHNSGGLTCRYLTSHYHILSKSVLQVLVFLLPKVLHKSNNVAQSKPPPFNFFRLTKVMVYLTNYYYIPLPD